MKINVCVNVKNCLIKVYSIKYLFGILAIASVNVINLVILGNIQIIQIVKVEKKLVNKLVEECIKSIDEVEITEITQAENKSSSCTLHIVLFQIFFTLSIGISTYFVYYKYMSRIKKMFPDMITPIKQKITNIRVNGLKEEIKEIKSKK